MIGQRGTRAAACLLSAKHSHIVDNTTYWPVHLCAVHIVDQ